MDSRPSTGFHALAGAALILAACVTPARVTTMAAPGFNACNAKTFVFLAPRDYTRLQWLSQEDHRRRVEDILRKHLAGAGLSEAPNAALAVYYAVDAQDHSPRDVSTGTVVMASDFRLGTLTMRLQSASTGETYWTVRSDQVLGTQTSSTLQTLDDGLTKAFREFPKCPSK